MTRLNQQTAAVLDAVEQGETFKIIRHRKVVGYLTAQPSPPPPSGQAYDWEAHFLRVQGRGKIPTAAADWERRPEVAR
jgi:antitoxin (DNA-binding transcriptional repressor) of toxin-antitoxin stability system